MMMMMMMMMRIEREELKPVRQVFVLPVFRWLCNRRWSWQPCSCQRGLSSGGRGDAIDCWLLDWTLAFGLSTLAFPMLIILQEKRLRFDVMGFFRNRRLADPFWVALRRRWSWFSRYFVAWFTTCCWQLLSYVVILLIVEITRALLRESNPGTVICGCCGKAIDCKSPLDWTTAFGLDVTR
jgi:hypothetical protein